MARTLFLTIGVPLGCIDHPSRTNHKITRSNFMANDSVNEGSNVFNEPSASISDSETAFRHAEVIANQKMVLELVNRLETLTYLGSKVSLKHCTQAHLRNFLATIDELAQAIKDPAEDVLEALEKQKI